MKINSRFLTKEKNFSKRKNFCNKCLAKDIKPKQLLILIFNLILLNFVFLKFRFNFFLNLI